MDQLVAGFVALLLYPGGVLAAGLGLALEAAAAWALFPARGAAWAGRSALGLARAALRRPAAVPGVAGLLALLAATQVATPFNPLAAPGRNSLVAAGALMAATWLGWAWAADRPRTDARLALGVGACWLLAVLLPSIAPQNVRPQVLGAIAVPALLPLKIACGALYLACLAPLLQLLPESAPHGRPGERPRRPDRSEDAAFAAVRALLWVPYCGLFASLFFPPSGDDPVGVLRFLLLVAGSGAVGIGLGAHLARRPPGTTAVLFRRLALPFAAFAVLVAAVTAIVD